MTNMYRSRLRSPVAASYFSVAVLLLSLALVALITSVNSSGSAGGSPVSCIEADTLHCPGTLSSGTLTLGQLKVSMH